jgi:transcriptional regulator with XRE-family HTH domain
MKTETDHKHYGAFDDEPTPDFLAFEHALDFLFAVAVRMEELGISKTELAKLMGVSQSRLTQIFDSSGSMTLKTLAKLEIALDLRVDFENPVNAAAPHSVARESLPTPPSAWTWSDFELAGKDSIYGKQPIRIPQQEDENLAGNIYQSGLANGSEAKAITPSLASVNKQGVPNTVNQDDPRLRISEMAA